jgi:hypothetical protein
VIVVGCSSGLPSKDGLLVDFPSLVSVRPWCDF